MLSFTKAMADMGVRDGAQVNVINPGAVRTARFVTSLQPLSKEKAICSVEAEVLVVADSGITKIGEPEHVANLVAFIVSPQNRYVHGELIDLGGGMTKTI